MTENMDNESLSQNHEFICTICEKPFNEPIKTVCGHNFCDACIKSWLNTSPTCPLCKTGIDVQSDIFPDKYTERKIKDVLVSCPNADEGCFETIFSNELNQHLGECLFKPFIRQNGHFLCSFYKIGCNEAFRSEDSVIKHNKKLSKLHLELALKQMGNYERKYLKERRVNLVKTHKENFLKLNYHPILINGTSVWIVDNIIEKLQSKTSVSKFCYSKVNGYKFNIELTFSGDNAVIKISMVSKASDNNLQWPCKINVCKICVLKTSLQNEIKDGISTAGYECCLSGDNTTNIIELHTNLDELRRHAIDNQLFVKVVMIFN